MRIKGAVARAGEDASPLYRAFIAPRRVGTPHFSADGMEFSVAVGSFRCFYAVLRAVRALYAVYGC